MEKVVRDEKSKKRRWVLVSLAITSLIFFCAYGSCRFYNGPVKDSLEVADFNAYIPEYLVGRDPEGDFRTLYNFWHRLREPHRFNQGTYHDTRAHVACALILFFWKKLSSEDRKQMYNEAKQYLQNQEYLQSHQEKYDTYKMSNRLVVIKWNRVQYEPYMMSEEESQIWEDRGLIFGMCISPE